MTEARTEARDSRGRFPVAFVVVVGLAVSVLGLPADPLFLAGIGVLGAAYYGLMVGAVWCCEASGPRLRAMAYFVVQLVLAALIFELFRRQGSFGMQWLILMPLVAQARLVLSVWGTAMVCVAGVALAAAHLQSLAGWAAVPGFVGGIATAIVFVLFFVQMGMREAGARAESERLGRELAEANRELAAYAVTAEELATARERSRLAREIHDGLGHSLTAVNVQLEAAQAVLDRDPDKARDAVRSAQSLAREGLGEVRRSVAALRASPLEHRRLDEALARLADRDQAAGAPVVLEVLGEPRGLSPQAELTLYRTAQEGLTNVRKHARAKRAGLVLDYRRPESVRLTVHDDGVGSDDPAGGFGLLGVRERVRQLAGRFEVRTGHGHGLTLEVEVPG